MRPGTTNGSKRILVIADSVIPVPPLGYGGTEPMVAYLVERLLETGYEVTFMGAPPSGAPLWIIQV